jgi:flagellar biosynthesis protein FliQ
MYLQKNLWPLTTMMQMPKNCESCGQRTELESGFYFGTGYVSYALSVAFLVAFFVAYHVIIGLSIARNTVIPCLITAIILLILIQPWMMRLSRILYLSAFVSYDANWQKK